MRRLLTVALALTMAACGDDAGTPVPGESPEMVLIAVNERGDVFLSPGDPSLRIEELPTEIERILNDGGPYHFVIQPETVGGPYAKQIEEVLLNSGVEENRVVISRSRP